MFCRARLIFFPIYVLRRWEHSCHIHSYVAAMFIHFFLLTFAANRIEFRSKIEYISLELQWRLIMRLIYRCRKSLILKKKNLENTTSWWLNQNKTKTLRYNLHLYLQWHNIYLNFRQCFLSFSYFFFSLICIHFYHLYLYDSSIRLHIFFKYQYNLRFPIHLFHLSSRTEIKNCQFNLFPNWWLW